MMIMWEMLEKGIKSTKLYFQKVQYDLLLIQFPQLNEILYGTTIISSYLSPVYIKTASTISSGSHPYSSDSEDDLAERASEVHVENSTQESPRSSSAQELSENGESEKSHHLIEESLEIETEDQDITKAAVETQPLPREESCENILEEMQKGTQQIAENLFEKSRKPTSKEEKEKSKLWEVGTAKVKDKTAGLPEVEKEGKYGL